MTKHKNESRTEHKNWVKMLENLDSNQEKAKQNWSKKLKDYDKAKAMFDKVSSALFKLVLILTVKDCLDA
jgi:hypothetical protein